MAYHTFVSNRVHCIFSTKDRRPIIREDLQPRLWAYMVGIARESELFVYAIGGTSDHSHVFVGIPPMMTVAKSIQVLKANSSRWLRQECNLPLFGWQTGYAAFSVSISHTDATIQYIRTQPEHHCRRTFDTELAMMLHRHGFALPE